MAGRPGAFHHKHGANIRLKENDTVAHRVDSYNKAVVFTEQPIPLGAMFQVRILDKGGGWAGSIRFGFTVCCPDSIPVPSGALDLYRSSDYWILSASTVHHNGQERKVDFNLEQLRVGQTIGCVVNKEGQMKYFVDGKEPGYLGWTGLPTDKPLWGFADIYGLARKIKSEFLCGE
ncbi:Neuralized-like protein 4 [Geodia barretti]|uniref:Neuralized-like protein 4 n=1 Tax=Geodia barretti TaxID=519541 RepID=A0AA35WCE1_GEOBA|nr:Neuralized-like protein 4 [Geodia barretti]